MADVYFLALCCFSLFLSFLRLFPRSAAKQLVLTIRTFRWIFGSFCLISGLCFFVLAAREIDEETVTCLLSPGPVDLLSGIRAYESRHPRASPAFVCSANWFDDRTCCCCFIP